MKELYSGHDEAVVMLPDVLQEENCKIEDIIGDAVIMPVLSELLNKQVVLVSESKL